MFCLLGSVAPNWGGGRSSGPPKGHLSDTRIATFSGGRPVSLWRCDQPGSHSPRRPFGATNGGFWREGCTRQVLDSRYGTFNSVCMAGSLPPAGRDRGPRRLRRVRTVSWCLPSRCDVRLSITSRSVIPKDPEDSPDAGDTNIYLFLADSKAGSMPAALAAAHSPDTIQVWKD